MFCIMLIMVLFDHDLFPGNLTSSAKPAYPFRPSKLPSVSATTFNRPRPNGHDPPDLCPPQGGLFFGKSCG